MISTWINVARSAFNAGKIWVSDDPDYVEIREAIKADFQQNVVNAFNEGYYGPPKQKQVLLQEAIQDRFVRPFDSDLPLNDLSSIERAPRRESRGASGRN